MLSKFGRLKRARVGPKHSVATRVEGCPGFPSFVREPRRGPSAREPHRAGASALDFAFNASSRAATSGARHSSRETSRRRVPAAGWIERKAPPTRPNMHDLVRALGDLRLRGLPGDQGRVRAPSIRATQRLWNLRTRGRCGTDPGVAARTLAVSRVHGACPVRHLQIRASPGHGRRGTHRRPPQPPHLFSQGISYFCSVHMPFSTNLTPSSIHVQMRCFVPSSLMVRTSLVPVDRPRS